ncbi:MAG: hypothetical protein K6E13_07645 [Lachnospiraceae bacterium]|nr:hypothetical protein [Lachnospiraceae bacterium]
MSRDKRGVYRAVIILVAVAFIAIGLFGNEFFDVMSKGVMICLECMGIG